MKRILYTLWVLTVLLCTHISLAVETGFDLLFTSNTKEYENLRIQMEGSVPQWLQGTLVSSQIFL